IVAPIHLLQRRDSPLGLWRGGFWGMNTATQHSPLESFLLFRGIESYGLSEAAFARISDSLQNNHLVRNDPNYDAARLNPKALQELFLNLLWEELKSESETLVRSDGELDKLSPASKKRKLQPPPPPTLSDARRHVDKIEAIYLKLEDEWLRQAIEDVRGLEDDYEQVEGEIRRLEETERTSDGRPATQPKPPNGVAQDYAVKREPVHVNGISATAKPSPKPPTQISPPVPPPIPTSIPAPALPQVPGQALAETPPTPTPPALAPVPAAPSNLGHTAVPPLPNSGPSPQLGQQNTPRPQPLQPQDIPKAPNGTPQVLQPPRGIPLQQQPQQFTPVPAADGLHRQDQGSQAKQSPTPLPSGALQEVSSRRESGYPGHHNSARHPMPHGQQQQQQQQQRPQQLFQQHNLQQQRQQQQQLHSQPSVPTTQPAQSTQAPQVLQPQRPVQPPQHVVSSGPRPLQPQTSKPLQQQTQPQHLQQAQNAQLPPLAQASQVPQHLPHHLAHIRPAPENQSYTNQPWSPYAHGPQNRVSQPQHPSYQNYAPSGVRSPANHSPLPSPTGLHPRAGQLAPPQPHQQQQPITQPQALPPLQAPSPFSQRHPPSGPPSPALPLGDSHRGYNSPYQQHPRGAVPDRIHQNRPPVATTPVQPTARFALIPSAPHTPIPTFPLRLLSGSGTSWSKNSTPSTPKNGPDWRFSDPESPAPEPLSPVQTRAVLPSVAPRDEIKSEDPAPERASQPTAPLPPVETPNSKRKPGRPHVPRLNVDLEPTKIKDEVTTPNHGTDAWDTAAEESRKRDELSPTPAQTPGESQVPNIPEASGAEPNTVVWTRSFHKVSASAMEQIVRHRLANMFAAPIRERDAPGYHKRIIQPTDLKSIRAAITTGNRAAAQAAQALPGGDPGTSAVRLPISEELIPPKAIINSNQLDCELAHMFANAIMYNPDHGFGPGPSFMVEEDEENDDQDGEGEDHGGAAGHPAGHQGQEHVLGYKVDEYGVVHDTRSMFQDVDTWLSELRSAEIQRGMPPATGTSTRQASVAQGEQSFSTSTATFGTAGGALGGDTTMDDADELTATEPETTVKRRRTTRNV
ncbi:hypothetical protein V8F20_002789, partial [Naviculisporaceae sp. PSN 640]